MNYKGIILSLILFGMIGAAGAQIPDDAPILSEFICNPMGELETEWIELYNPTEISLNLTHYQIGDALGLRNISDTGIILAPGEYIVLAEDPIKFVDFYTDFSGVVISPIGWQTLNNYGPETVRLADNTGETIDSCYYDDGFADNRSWERYVNATEESFWGGSFAATGSTPGEQNAFYYPRAEAIDLAVTPDPFSPDGNGFEDVTVISFGMPEADDFELAIYDIAGRKVRTFYQSDATIPGEVVWDGRGDGGETLPIGIYIIYARIEGGRSIEAKRTVVIARN